MAKRKTKLEKQKDEFLSFYNRTELILRETDINARVLSNDTREKIIDSKVDTIMDSWDRSWLRDIVRCGWKGYDETSDLNLIAEHIQYVEDVYEDISECEQLTFDIKADCELYITEAIDKAIGL
jgi:hypothetical protein